MFTGLIEAVGEVLEVVSSPAGLRIRFTAPMARELAPGDSVAVNGVCLTVVTSDGSAVNADISPETVRVTTLGTLQPRSAVNLERPLQAGARLGGHFVQGHVDATGTIARVVAEGTSYRVSFGYPAEMASALVRKGSVAVDGISLTVADVSDAVFDVQVIPFTWTHTTLGRLGVGDAVNLEFDILGKYVARALEAHRPQGT